MSASWLVVDSLYCPEQYFASHLDSYGHYLAEAGEDVARACLNYSYEELGEPRGHWLDGEGLGDGRLRTGFDVAFFLDGYARAPKVEANKRIAQVAAVCSPMPWDARKPDGSPAFDLVVSSIPWMVQASIDAGTPARYQPLCFDLRARACMMGVKRDLDCIFIGSTGGNHVRRTRLLEELKDVVTVLPPVFGREYFRTLARAKVVLNVHAEWARGAANAMRLFEGVGLGCEVVSDGEVEPICGHGDEFWFSPDGDRESNWRDSIELALSMSQMESLENTGKLMARHTYENRIPQLIEWARSL